MVKIYIVMDERGDDMDEHPIPVTAFSTRERAAQWIKDFASAFDDLADAIEAEFSVLELGFYEEEGDD